VRERAADRREGVLRGRVAVAGREGAVEIAFRAERRGERGLVEGSFEIPYQAWGLPDPSTFLLRVADRVRVHVRGEGALRPAPPR
jgi:hypothetical protein